jgi:hypothetical protein
MEFYGREFPQVLTYLNRGMTLNELHCSLHIGTHSDTCCVIPVLNLQIDMAWRVLLACLQ